MNSSPQTSPASARRTRILALFNDPDSAPIVILRTPWGFEKSTLITWWSETSTAPVLGMTVDPSSTERLDFWTATAGQLPDPAEEWNEPEPGIEAVLARLAAAGPFSLTIQCFELLEDPDAISRDICDLIDRNPGVRVLIGTRTETLLESSRTRMHANVRVLGASELAFTDAELAAEATERGRTDPALTAMLAVVTERIPLLVKFALLELSKQASPRALDIVERWLVKRVDAFIADTLLREDAGILDEVIAADVLDELLAQALTERDGAYVIRVLERQGLGAREELVVDGDSSGTVFRFTEVVTRALRPPVARRDETRYSQRRRVFATWARQRDIPQAALAAAVEVEDFPLASAIVADFWFDLGSQKPAVIAALHPLPRRTLGKWPLLAAELALCYIGMKDHQWKAAEMFAVALTGIGLQRGKASPTERMLFTLLEMVAARTVFGSYKQARQLAHRLGQMLLELPVNQYDQAHRLIPHVISQIAATQLFSGATQDALLTLISGTVTAQNVGAPLRAQYFPLSLRAGAHAIAGEMDEAERFVEISDAVSGQEHRHNDYSGSPARIAEAYLHLEAGRYQEALEVMRKLHPHYRTIENIHLLMETETWAYVGIDPARGLERIIEVRKFVERQRRLPGYVLAHLDRSATRAALASGRITLASQYLRGTAALGDVAHATLRAKVDLARQANTDALGHLLRYPPDPSTTRRDTLDHELALATAYFRNHHRDAALTVLRGVAASLSTAGLTIPLLAHRQLGYAELMTLANEEGIPFPRLPESVPVSDATQVGAPPKLTRRELAVLRELMSNPGYAEIATELAVSINTVRTQVRSLYKKLDVKTREDALSAALSFHLLDDIRHIREREDS